MTERKPSLEATTKQIKIDASKNLTKAIGVPTLVLGGIVGISNLLTYPIENNDLHYILSNGISFLGGIACSRLIINYPIEKFNEFRNSWEDIRRYKKELKYLQ